MKPKLIFTAFLSLFILLSCKDKEVQNENKDVVPVEVVQKNNITLTLSAVVKKDDVFQIFYKNEEAEGFVEAKSISVDFKGSETEQKIVFSLPEDEYPNYIRLDFGVNKEQDPIEIKNLTFKFYEKSFEVKGEDFSNYFYSNGSIEIADKTKGVLKLIVGKDGNYDPMSASADGLRKQLEELVQQP